MSCGSLKIGGERARFDALGFGALGFGALDALAFRGRFGAFDALAFRGRFDALGERDDRFGAPLDVLGEPRFGERDDRFGEPFGMMDRTRKKKG